VRQEADLFILTGSMADLRRSPRLRAALVTGVLGVFPHLDSRRFAVLVAIFTIFTIQGSARFALCKDRAGAIIQAWEADPGSLTLLRGPGLLDAEDHRPFHTVQGPTAGRRCSITRRVNQQRR
jgi:hypothetical protein